MKQTVPLQLSKAVRDALKYGPLEKGIVNPRDDHLVIYESHRAFAERIVRLALAEAERP